MNESAGKVLLSSIYNRNEVKPKPKAIQEAGTL